MKDLNFVKREKTKVRRVYFVIAVITVILVVLAINFAKYILKQEYISAEKQLKQGVLQTASNLRGRVSVNINELNTLSAKFSASVKTLDEKEVTEFLASHIMDYDYNVLFFAYPGGKTIKYQQGVGKLKPENWTTDNRFQTVLSGGPVYVTTRVSNDDPPKYTNVFGVPVYGDDKIIGVLGAQFDADIYIRILGFNNYDKQGLSYIINREGSFLIKPQRDKDTTKNFFDRNIKLINKTQQEILEMLDEEQHGSFTFFQDGKKYAAAFAPVDNNNKTINRHVLTMVPFDVLLFHVGDLLKGLVAITIIISAALIGFLCYSNYLLIRHTDVISDIAFVDKVTGSANKNKFLIKAKEILEHYPDKKFAMVCAEISKFKAINELLGFEDANVILKDFNSILVRNLSGVGACARDHSSTFAILFEYDKEEYVEKYFIRKIIDDVKAYNSNAIPEFARAAGALLNTTLAVSFGIYLIDDRELTVDRMYEKANIAKRAIGENVIRSSCRFYDDALRAQILQDKTIEDEMQSALEGNQFHMFLQPKFDLQTKELSGAEALVRWIHPTKGMIPPMQFIPLFEKNGFVTELDRCIWRQACQFLAERQKEGQKLFPISVNVSRVHMENDKFIDELILLTRKYGIDPKYLELELTESACIDDEKRFEEAVNTLKNLGFVVSMDDFGTGYSSLNMLRKLPIDVLKLDRGFIKDTIQDIKGQMVTRSIIEMANKLNMLTVAEGIETEEQAEFLRSVGCKIAQGFLYGKPVDVETFKSTFMKAGQA